MSDLSRLASALRDRYVLESELGRGGMAVVYLARDLKHDRKVAIKVLVGEAMNEVTAERFLRETRTAARLNHPHILPVFDSGDAAGCLYYVMPCVEGESLRERIERTGPLSLPDACRLGLQLCEALEHAHARGVVHRDIKPGNVLLPKPDHAFLADFGLACGTYSASADRLTSTGMAVGSPQYMAPEQASGVDGIDGRTDLYALGCVLFEMLIGRPPFVAPTWLEVLRLHMVEAPPNARKLRRDVPETIDSLIRRMLAKKPGLRPASAGRVAEVLRQELARSPGEAKRGALWRKETIWGVGLASLALATTLILQTGVLTRGVNRGSPTSLLDTSRIAIFPLAHSPELDGEGRADWHLQAWLGGDTAFAVPDTFEVAAQLAAIGRRHLSPDQAHTAALGLRAGRYLLSSVEQSDSGLFARVSLYEAAGVGRLLRTVATKLPSESPIDWEIPLQLAAASVLGTQRVEPAAEYGIAHDDSSETAHIRDVRAAGLTPEQQPPDADKKPRLVSDRERGNEALATGTRRTSDDPDITEPTGSTWSPADPMVDRQRADAEVRATIDSVLAPLKSGGALEDIASMLIGSAPADLRTLVAAGIFPDIREVRVISVRFSVEGAELEVQLSFRNDPIKGTPRPQHFSARIVRGIATWKLASFHLI